MSNEKKDSEVDGVVYFTHVQTRDESNCASGVYKISCQSVGLVYSIIKEKVAADLGAQADDVIILCLNRL